LLPTICEFLIILKGNTSMQPAKNPLLSIQKSKSGTIKTYANKIQEKAKETEILFYDSDNLPKKPASTFEHMHWIFEGKKVQEGTIFLIDEDIDTLINLITLIKEEDTLSVKIGVLLRINGHTTPLCIEKKIEERDNGDVENIYVYHTDSTVMDIDVGGTIKEIIHKISEKGICCVYSLGIIDKERNILRNYKRQSDEQSCATFSLFDVEQMLKMDFFQFANKNSERVERIYTH
jgi:hypothetical protein